MINMLCMILIVNEKQTHSEYTKIRTHKKKQTIENIFRYPISALSSWNTYSHM